MESVYIEKLLNSVPPYLFEILLIVGIITILIFLLERGVKVGMMLASRVLLLEITFLIFSSTIFFRGNVEERKYSLMPFQSYRMYFDGWSFLLSEIIMNILIFVPIGFFACLAFPMIKRNMILLGGVFLSCLIELMQYVFQKGLAEFDDVMHNTLGCLVGIGMFLIIRKTIIFSESLIK